MINKASRVTHTWSQYVSLPKTLLQEVAGLQGMTAALTRELCGTKLYPAEFDGSKGVIGRDTEWCSDDFKVINIWLSSFKTCFERVGLGSRNALHPLVSTQTHTSQCNVRVFGEPREAREHTDTRTCTRSSGVLSKDVFLNWKDVLVYI